MNLEELVKIVEAGKPELQAHVKEVVEWILSKPEGRAVLEEAHALHGKPLKLLIHPEVPLSHIGYNDHMGSHAILGSLEFLNDSVLLTKEGQKIPFTLERFLTHEFKHGAQLGAGAAGEKAAVRRAEIATAVIPQAPAGEYTQRLNAAQGNANMLRRIYGEIYDTHIGPFLTKAEQLGAEKMAQDETLQEIAKRYEIPAIEFENMMMSKYRGEPQRLTDYARSAYLDATNSPAVREQYINSELERFRLDHAQKNGRAIPPPVGALLHGCFQVTGCGCLRRRFCVIGRRVC